MDVELTELEKLEVTRVDAVGRPANGFPVLLMKGLAEPAAKAADTVDCPTCKGDGKIMGGKRDCPDCDAKGNVTPDKAKSIAAKSLTPEELLQSAMKAINDKRAALGRAPLDLDEALELVKADPAAEDAAGTAKSEIAKDEAVVDTVTQTGDLTEVVKAADTKAAALEKRVTDQESVIKALEGRLAKVEAAPVPGGLVLSRNVQVKQPGAVVNEKAVKDAAYYREQADLWSSQDRGTADGYRQMAREADAKAVTPTS